MADINNKENPNPTEMTMEEFAEIQEKRMNEEAEEQWIKAGLLIYLLKTFWAIIFLFFNFHNRNLL